MKKILLLAIVASIISFNISYSQMFWNQAGKFDTTTVFYFDNASVLNITGSFTIEAWLNPSDTATPGGLYANQRQVLYKNKYNITLNSGKPKLYINGTGILTFKTGIAPNQWNHIAFTFDSVSKVYSGYLNGTLDTSLVNLTTPASSSGDLLYIGSNPLQLPGASNYKGLMDDIRIWRRLHSQSEISTYFRTVLGINSGIYDGLVFALCFQQSNSFFGPASIDLSGNGVTLLDEIGLQYLNQTSRPQQTTGFNESMELDGSGDYASAPSVSQLTPSNSITLEAWIYPRSLSGGSKIIMNKGPASLISPNYSMGIAVTGKLFGTINGNTYISNTVLNTNQWTHVVFQFRQSGLYRFFVNGSNVFSGITSSSPINTGSDSLYIGGTSASGNFNGFIDEVRIESYYKSDFDIQKEMYISKDKYNENTLFNNVVYNLDGLQFANTTSGSALRFRNNARFSHPGTISNQPVSPLCRADNLNFIKGFYLKQSDRLIPETGTSGLMVEDSLNVELDETISDLNFFVALNHEFSNDVEITLVSPYGYESYVCLDMGQLGSDDNIITIFDDQAVSSLISGRYVSFAPRIKPQNSLNDVQSGTNSKGIWKLRINDDNSGNTGRLYSWGVQINNKVNKISTLSSDVLIQGFYNPATNNMVRDTMRFYLRNSTTPFALKDSAKSYLGVLGGATLSFNNTDTGKYYLQLKHRNSVDTWSSVPLAFDAFTQQLSINFRNDLTAAYGSNMIQIDTSPLRYAIYGGDANQDGLVDATDILLVFNDVSTFTTGYKVSDMNGDNITDATDLLLVFNNSINFIGAMRP